MSRTKLSKKRMAITTAALVAVGGGAAFAFWTSQGSGSGTSATGDSVPFTVGLANTDNIALSPGGPAQKITVTITNPGTGIQHLGNVSAAVDAPRLADGSAATGCQAANYSATVEPAITPRQMAANESITGTVVVKMINTQVNQDACKGVTVPITVAIAAQ